jgi:hypothetical protein
VRTRVRKKSLISRSLGSRAGSMARRTMQGWKYVDLMKPQARFAPDLFRASTSSCRPPILVGRPKPWKPGGEPGAMGVPDNSRFGGINSRLGSRKFPFTSRREFSRNCLIHCRILADERRFCGPESTNSRILSRFRGI